MCASNVWPTDGADAEYVRRPYRVLLTDEAGDRWTVTVRAIGKHDARNLAVEAAHDMGYVDVTALRIEAAA